MFVTILKKPASGPCAESRGIYSIPQPYLIKILVNIFRPFASGSTKCSFSRSCLKTAKEYMSVVPKVGCMASWGTMVLPNGALKEKGRQGVLEVGRSNRIVRLFMIGVTADQMLRNWYQFIKH
jgi:hypothetical protein